jgi:hypothetical protein
LIPMSQLYNGPPDSDQTVERLVRRALDGVPGDTSPGLASQQLALTIEARWRRSAHPATAQVRPPRPLPVNRLPRPPRRDTPRCSDANTVLMKMAPPEPVREPELDYGHGNVNTHALEEACLAASRDRATSLAVA